MGCRCVCVLLLLGGTFHLLKLTSCLRFIFSSILRFCLLSITQIFDFCESGLSRLFIQSVGAVCDICCTDDVVRSCPKGFLYNREFQRNFLLYKKRLLLRKTITKVLPLTHKIRIHNRGKMDCSDGNYDTLRCQLLPFGYSKILSYLFVGVNIYW